MGERDVADVEHDRAVAARLPLRVQRRRYRRSRSRRGWRGRAGRPSRAAENVSRSRIGIEEATNSVASGASAVDQLGGDARLAQLVAERRGDRVGGRAVGGAPALQPRRIARVAVLRRQRRERGARIAPRSARRRRRPGRATRPRRRARPAARRRGRRATLAAASTSAGRRRAAPARAAAPRRAARRAAARRSGRSRPARGARPTAGRRAAGSRPRAANAASAGPSAGSRSSRPATITARPEPRVAPIGARGARRRGATGRDPRPPAGAAGAGVVGRQRSVQHERLAQRQVEVDRAGAARRAPSRRRGRRARGSSAARAGVAACDADLDEPLGGGAVELDLVDRLPGADVAQLGRAVGRQHDQRDARLGASITAGVSSAAAVPDVQATATGRPRRLGQPEREEAGDALVDVRPGAQAAACARATARSASSASRGRCTRRSQPQRTSSSQKARSSRYVSVAVMRCGGWRRPSSPAPRLHADGPQLGAGDRGARRTLSRARARHPRPRERRRRRPVDFADVHADVARAPPERFVLGGYSMGGRIALRSRSRARTRRAARARRRSPGVAADGARRARRGRRAARRRDRARRSRRSPRAGPRCRCSPASRPTSPRPPTRPAAQDAGRPRRCAARARHGRAGAAVGPARELAMPVALIAGERDVKFRAIAAERWRAPGRARGPRRARRRPRGAPRKAIRRCPHRPKLHGFCA